MSLEGVSRDVLSVICGSLTLQDVARLSCVSSRLRDTAAAMRLAQVRVAATRSGTTVVPVLVRHQYVRRLFLPFFEESTLCVVLSRMPLLSHLVVADSKFDWDTETPPPGLRADHLESLTLLESGPAYHIRFTNTQTSLRLNCFVAFWSQAAPALKQLHIGTDVSFFAPSTFGGFQVQDNIFNMKEPAAVREMPSVQVLSLKTADLLLLRVFPNLTTWYCGNSTNYRDSEFWEHATQTHPRVAFVQPLLTENGELNAKGVPYVTDINAMGEVGIMHLLARNPNVEPMETVAKSFPNVNLDLRTCGAPQPPFEWQYPHFDPFKDVDFPVDTNEGFTPLMLAVAVSAPRENLMRMVRLGCSVECVTLRHRWTPLMIACALGSLDAVNLFVRDLGVDVFKKDIYGWTALHMLCATTMRVDYPYFPEAAYQVRDNYGLTPIDIAAAAGAFGSPMDAPTVDGSSKHVPRTDREASDQGEVRRVSDLVFFMVQRAFSWNLEANLLSLAPNLDSWGFRSPDDGSTPLIVAVRRNFLTLFAAILSTRSGRASLDLQDSQGRTALHWACEAREEALIEGLVNAGASTTVCDPEGCTPALYYLQSTNGTPISSTKILAMLVANRAGDFASLETGATPLLLSAYLWNDETCRLLLDDTSRAAAVSKGGHNVFHAAVSHSGLSGRNMFDFLSGRATDHSVTGEVSCVRTLKTLTELIPASLTSALLRQRNGDGQLPLHVAACKFKVTPEIAALLGAAESDICSTQDAELNTALHLACLRGNVELAAQLAAVPGLANVRNIRGETPLLLFLASLRSPPHLFSNLMTEGPHASTSGHSTMFTPKWSLDAQRATLAPSVPLSEAEPILNLLLPVSDLGVENVWGENAAMLSLVLGEVKVDTLPPVIAASRVWPLLEAVAGVAASDDGYAAYCAALQQRGANLSLANSSGMTLAMMALERGNSGLAAALLSLSNPSQTDSRGRTALHYAVEANCVSVIRLLRERQFGECNAADHCGVTPLRVAVAKCQLAAVRELLQCPGVRVTDEIRALCVAAIGCSLRPADLCLAKLLGVQLLFASQQRAAESVIDTPDESTPVPLVFRMSAARQTLPAISSPVEIAGAAMQQMMQATVPLFVPSTEPVSAPSPAVAADSIAHHRQVFVAALRAKSAASGLASRQARGVVTRHVGFK